MLFQQHHLPHCRVIGCGQAVYINSGSKAGTIERDGVGAGEIECRVGVGLVPTRGRGTPRPYILPVHIKDIQRYLTSYRQMETDDCG